MKTEKCTVCFADMSRFNVAVRNMSLNELVAFLQGFYERVGSALLSHNGRLVKYIGDSALMIFEGDREEVAVRAMWALRESFAGYVEELGGETRVSQLRAGLATGNVAVGQVGHPEMLSYDVLGRTVMVADALLKFEGITIDGATYDAVAGHIVAEPVDGSGELRGYRVIGLR